MAHRICLLSSEARASSQWPAHAYAGLFVCPSGEVISWCEPPAQAGFALRDSGKIKFHSAFGLRLLACLWPMPPRARSSSSSSSSQIDLDVNEAFSFSLSHTCKAKNQEAQTQR